MNIKRLGACAIIALASACSSENKPPARAAVEPVMNEAPPVPAVAPEVSKQATPALKVSEDIRVACGLPEPQMRFAYKSARVRRDDEAVLKQLTRCLTTGPLKARQMRLMGHADPRGSDEYNYALGQSRANNVKLAMLGLGLPAEQVQTTSRGKRDAVGTNEAGWAKDRRVEASLAP